MIEVHPPHFDTERKEWLLTRYADVTAALREPGLWPAGAEKNSNKKIPDRAAQERLRTATQEAFSSQRLAEWQTLLEATARALIESLPAEGPVEIVSAFIQPWCLAAAGTISGAEIGDLDRLLTFSREVSDSAAEPQDEVLQARASAANAELNRYFSAATVPMAGAAFVALSRTLACLLANGWLALMEEREVGRKPAPGIVEEMLRLAGIPAVLYRFALKDVAIGSRRIQAGERVALVVAAANRDPERGPAQLSLGFGGHSCAGAVLIRMAAVVATSAFLKRFRDARLCGEISWRGGVGFRWADAITLMHSREITRFVHQD